MKLPRAAIQPGATPVIDAVGGVGILLDLEDQIAGVDGMHRAAGHEDGITRRHWEAVHACLQRAAGKGLLKLRAGHARPQPHDERRPGRRSGDEPVLGFRLAAQGRRPVRRRMHLQAEPLPAIEPFHQDRETAAAPATAAP